MTVEGAWLVALSASNGANASHLTRGIALAVGLVILVALLVYFRKTGRGR